MKNVLTIILLLNVFVSEGQSDSIYSDLHSAEKNPLAVKHLFINDFKGSAIPKSLAKMKNLEFLVFKNSMINEIPDFIGRFEKLTVLSFWYSKIAKISDSISNLENLERLEIVGANLYSLDTNICKLTNLTHLNFLGNKITFVSPKISSLTKLKMLNICSWQGELFVDSKTKQMLIELFKGKCLLSCFRDDN